MIINATNMLLRLVRDANEVHDPKAMIHTPEVLLDWPTVLEISIGPSGPAVMLSRPAFGLCDSR